MYFNCKYKYNTDNEYVRMLIKYWCLKYDLVIFKIPLYDITTILLITKKSQKFFKIRFV